MRLAGPLAVALAACACAASGTSAAQSVKLRVAFYPDVLGARTTITLAVRVRGPHGAPPSPVTSFDLRLPPNMGIATTTLWTSQLPAGGADRLRLGGLLG